MSECKNIESGNKTGISREVIEEVIRKVLKERLGNSLEKACPDADKKEQAEGLIKVEVPFIKTAPSDRLDTGNPADTVYTHDLFSLEESPRLGCGVMEMERTTFDWHLDYDEIDYVMEGSLTIIKNGNCVTAGPGELILIPKGSSIQFSVPGKARFLYVTYPADWNG